MPPNRDSTVSYEPKTASELARFFKESSERYHEIWIILTKKAHADPQPVTFNEAVAVAAKQGLVDSRTKTLTEQKYAIRFTKRKRQLTNLRRKTEAAT